MKYRLRKDLPFARAGEEITIGKASPLGSGYYFHTRTLLMDDATFESLLTVGWIEEVKPREFWLNIHKSGNIYVESDIHKIERTIWGLNGENQIIKVREVVK